MKLLFSIYSLRCGGAERVTANLANHWARMGREVTVVTMLPASSDFYPLHPGVRRIALDLASHGGSLLRGIWNNTRRIRVLRRVLRQVQPQIAVSMMTTANVLLAFAAYGLPNTKTIGSERAHPPAVVRAGGAWGRLRRWSYGKLTAVAAQTVDAKAWLESNTLARHVAVIPNPVQWPLPDTAPVVVPEVLVGNGNRVLLAVGRLDPEKGLDRLIDIFSTLADKYPNWTLVILGEGTERKAMEAQISTRGMARKILLPGGVGNVAQWYSRADLYVLSSHSEGFPNTLLEALSYGLPAVSFDCDSGPRDIIRHEVDGLLVPPGDVSGLTAALDRLMRDDLMRSSFSERAREARERFSMEHIAGMWDALFMKIRSGRN